MVTVKYGDKCDLCALPVEISGFSLLTAQGNLVFCCAGCQSIYRLIYMNKQTLALDDNTTNNKDK